MNNVSQRVINIELKSRTKPRAAQSAVAIEQMLVLQNVLRPDDRLDELTKGIDDDKEPPKIAEDNFQQTRKFKQRPKIDLNDNEDLKSYLNARASACGSRKVSKFIKLIL